ncbi:hypothetical protein EAY16_20790 [Vibrio anguillarum]|nr:hypothetical protein CEG15_13125 [Vibrio anguillarum]ASG04879.1 hypothetical protein CEJ46_13895 [Vibrio anguillarum]MBF4284160.1 hypothetical protein [Vibrio anguillarum]MBF4287496.1 hypothetical protein [Vibrio anguillarum]MBF4327719.1 hypothetical protein [Vibrio anguillarum]
MKITAEKCSVFVHSCSEVGHEVPLTFYGFMCLILYARRLFGVFMRFFFWRKAEVMILKPLAQNECVD